MPGSRMRFRSPPMRAGQTLPTFYGQVGTRCYVPTALGDNQQYMVQSGHDIYAPTGGIVTLYTAEANFWVSNSTFLDSTTGGTLSVSMGVEYPSGTFTRSTWAGGATSATIPANSIGWNKTVLNLPAGKSRVNFYRRLQHSASIGLNRQANGGRRYLTGGDAVEITTTDKTLTGGVVDAGTGIVDFMIWPAAIVAAMTNPTVILSGLFDGDSRTIGEKDNAPTNEHQGVLAHSLGPIMPYQNFGVAGQPFVDYSANTLRAALGQYSTTFLTNNGYNSRASSGSAMYTASHTAASYFSPREAWFGTVYCGASSTDGWITTVNQSTDGFNSNRTAYNDLLRADPRCIEIADIIESARNSGIFKAHNPGYTDDGVHLLSPGVALVDLTSLFTPSSSLDFASFMPSTAPV